MSKLSQFSIDDLERELEKRKLEQEKDFTPVEFDAVRYMDFVVEMQSIMDSLIKNGWDDSDNEHYAFESAFKLVFGDDVFEKLSNIIY